jgi:hypothetical protein
MSAERRPVRAWKARWYPMCPGALNSAKPCAAALALAGEIRRAWMAFEPTATLAGPYRTDGGT